MTNSTDNPIVSADARGRVTLGSWAQDSKFSVTNNLDGTVTLTPEAKPEPITEDLMVYAHRQAPGIYVTKYVDNPFATQIQIKDARADSFKSLVGLLGLTAEKLDLPVVVNTEGTGGIIIDLLSEDFPDVTRVGINPSCKGGRDWPSYREWRGRNGASVRENESYTAIGKYWAEVAETHGDHLKVEASADWVANKHAAGGYSYPVELREETLEVLKKATATEIVTEATEDIYEKIKGLTLGEFHGDSPENVENRRLLNLLARGK